MNRQRVISFVDGLNLFHAISSLKQPEYHWVDLIALSKVYLKSHSEKLQAVYYFSSFADHIDELKQKCQKAHMKALEIRTIKLVLGHFKKKDRRCPSCNHKWIGHEEKETDVNIALYLLDLAYNNVFDRALIFSNDSDLAPAIQMVRKRFPEKRITIVSPPECYVSYELIQASTDKTKVRREHLERCLLPLVVSDASGLISVSRPQEYMPVPSPYTLRG